MPASRTPKCRWGWTAERVPLVPTAPRRSPADTCAPGVDRDRGQVQVRGVEPVAGPHAHGQARRAGGPGEQHLAARCRHDRRGHRRRDVDPAVLPSGIGVVAVPVRSDDVAPDRPAPRGVCGSGEEKEGGEGDQESAHPAMVRARARGGTARSQGCCGLLLRNQRPVQRVCAAAGETRPPRSLPCADARRLPRAREGHRPRRGPPRPTASRLSGASTRTISPFGGSAA